MDPVTLRAQALQDVIRNTTPRYPAERFAGKGIVTCAGGPRYFTCVWVCVNVLRRILRCTLPIQLWYLGPEEMSARMLALLEKLNVECVDMHAVAPQQTMSALRGHGIKAYAATHSRFEQVIFIDADNVPVVDPAFLLSHSEYDRTGAVFWPDIDRLGSDHPIWDACRVPFTDEPGFESGQMVIDKRRCWKALLLTLQMNERSDYYDRYLKGDKETWHMAWRMLDQPFSMTPYPAQHVPGMLNQHDFDGRAVFQHRTMAKWIAWGENPRIPGFVFEDACRKFLNELRGQWDGWVCVPIPSALGKIDLVAEEELVETRWFIYCRIGSDQRLLEFLPNHRIGRGSARCEEEWHVREANSASKLIIEGTCEGWLTTTCELTRHADGVWRGQWLHSEKMPVQLIPQADRSETDGEPEDAELQAAQTALSWSGPGRSGHLAALQTIILIAASRPLAVRRSTMQACARLLRMPGLEAKVYDQAVYAMGACAHSRPDLIERECVSGVGTILVTPGLPAERYELVAEVLGFFLTTPQAAHAVEMVETLLLRTDLDPACYGVLVRTLQNASLWRTDLFNYDRLLRILDTDHLSSYRDELLESVVERLLFFSPEAVTLSVLDRLTRCYAAHPSSKYFFYYLSGRHDVSESVHDQAEKSLAGRFSLHERVRRQLAQGRKRIVLVQNIADAQGDEIIRTVTLTQALLDFNPSLEIVLITANPHWYDHPRITVVPLEDQARIAAALTVPCDGVIDFFEPQVLEVDHSLALERRVQEYVGSWRPFLYISARKGWNHFVYQRVDVAGEPWAQSLGLDEVRFVNVYEPTFRLIAELGLPLRAGEEQPEAGSALTGLPSREAEHRWHELVGANIGGEQRPVAIVNPFGGVEPLKGFVERKAAELAEQIRGLIVEGFFVVLIPNGMPWGTEAVAGRVVARLAPREKAHVVIAPDPSAHTGLIEQDRASRALLPYRGHIMRLFKYFVSFADLVITIEGWMAHLAYCLAKPFRLFMAPYSHPFDWHPYGRTRRQDVVLAFAPAVWGCLPEDPDTPPLPNQPRKRSLLLLLRALGTSGDARALPLLRQALESEDRHVRQAATRSLGKIPNLMGYSDRPIDADLHALLHDSASAVRAAAAEALLARTAEVAEQIEKQADSPRREHLLAYQWIGSEPRKWGRVKRLGEAARPALQVALRDDDPVVRREAAETLRILDARRISVY